MTGWLVGSLVDGWLCTLVMMGVLPRLQRPPRRRFFASLYYSYVLPQLSFSAFPINSICWLAKQKLLFYQPPPQQTEKVHHKHGRTVTRTLPSAVWIARDKEYRMWPHPYWLEMSFNQHSLFLLITPTKYYQSNGSTTFSCLITIKNVNEVKCEFPFQSHTIIGNIKVTPYP